MKTFPKTEILLPASAMAMRYGLASLIQVGMANAMIKGKLPDLKGLVNPEHVSETDLQLLAALGDPVSDRILETIELIDQALIRLENINNFVLEDFETYPSVLDMAEQFFELFDWRVQDQDFAWDVEWIFLNLMGLCYELSRATINPSYSLDAIEFGSDFQRQYFQSGFRFLQPEDESHTNTQLWKELFLAIEEKYKSLIG